MTLRERKCFLTFSFCICNNKNINNNKFRRSKNNNNNKLSSCNNNSNNKKTSKKPLMFVPL